MDNESLSMEMGKSDGSATDTIQEMTKQESLPIEQSQIDSELSGSSTISNRKQDDEESSHGEASEHTSLNADIDEVECAESTGNADVTSPADPNLIDDLGICKGSSAEKAIKSQSDEIDETTKSLTKEEPESAKDHDAPTKVNATLEEGDNKGDQNSRFGGLYQSLRNSFAVRSIVGPVSTEGGNIEDNDDNKFDDHPNNRERGRDSGGVVSGVSKTLSSIGDSTSHFADGTTRPIASSSSVVAVDSSLAPTSNDTSSIISHSATPITSSKDQNFVSLASVGSNRKHSRNKELANTSWQRQRQQDSWSSRVDENTTAEDIISDSQGEAQGSATPNQLRPWFMPMSLLRENFLRPDNDNMTEGNEDEAQNEDSFFSPQPRRSSFWWTMGQTPPPSVRERHTLPSSRPRTLYPLRRVMSDNTDTSHSSSRIKLIDKDSGCIAEQSSEDTFQVSIRIPKCKAQDVVDMVGRPELLLQWCKSLETVEILNAHETHLNATDLASNRNLGSEVEKLDNRSDSTKPKLLLRRSTRQFDAEWIEASATFRQPGKYQRGCLRKCREALTRLSTNTNVKQSNGKLLLFVERRRKQIALTLSNFEQCEVSHTLNFVQSREDVHVSDMVSITREASASYDDDPIPNDDMGAEQHSKDSSADLSCCRRIVSYPASCITKLIGPAPPIECSLTDHIEQSISSMKCLSTLMSTAAGTNIERFNEQAADSLSTPLLKQSEIT